jgi:hypothetical protein
MEKFEDLTGYKSRALGPASRCAWRYTYWALWTREDTTTSFSVGIELLAQNSKPSLLLACCVMSLAIVIVESGLPPHLTFFRDS